MLARFQNFRDEKMYYNIDDILAEDERVTCEFLTDAVDCGYLDPSCPTADLPCGSKVELPLWLASSLAQKNDVRVHVPPYFASKFRKHIRASPASVNLRDKSQYFYKIGSNLTELLDETDSEEVKELLRIAFGGERYRRILDQSMNSRDEDTTEFTRKLTHMEKELFEKGLLGARDFYEWKNRSAGILRCASILDSERKKRRFT